MEPDHVSNLNRQSISGL